ncbi:MAG: hypothetical protein AAFW81_12220 [Pseudomonadota bacterium]
MRRSIIVASTGFLCLSVFAAPALGQEMEPASDTTRFILDTAILVTGGLSAMLFIVAYGLRDIGLARVQNAPAVCLRMLASFAVSMFAFWLFGFELAFSVEEGGLLGDAAAWSPSDADPIALGRASGAAWFFHATLAGLAASIVAASVSERVRLWAFLIFVGFLAGLILPIALSWVWGGGYFAHALRYADVGGVSIHIIAGAAALAAAFVVGPRPGRFNAKSPWIAATAMLPLSVFAAGLAWIALQGVIAGLSGPMSSAADAIRLGVIIGNLSIATAAAVLSALVITQFVYDRPGLVTTMCAVIAGPVSLAGDPVSPNLWQAAMIGAVGGVIVAVAPPFLARSRIDDAGFVAPTHLLCGLWGAVIAAWVNPDLDPFGQAAGAGAIAAFGFIMSLLIWTALKFSPLGARQKMARVPPADPTPPTAQSVNRN